MCELIAYILLFPISTVGKQVGAGTYNLSPGEHTNNPFGCIRRPAQLQVDREQPPEMIIVSDYVERFSEASKAVNVPPNRIFFPDLLEGCRVQDI
ncbi:hypothetical protein RSAG8_10921, partial [Rhizoctonia solani AG-8 WAC10335]